MKLTPCRLRPMHRQLFPCVHRENSVSSCSTVAVVAALFFLGGSAGASPPASPGSVHPELWPLVTPLPLDSATETFVQKLMSQMSLEEKVGQMIQADIASISPAELTRYKLGSILAGGGAAPGNNVRSPPQAWLALTDSFHRASLATRTAHP